MVQPTSPASAANLMVSATTSGASPNPFSRSAETGNSVALTIRRACASASSRVSWPSRRPRAQAEAALDVAKAWKPSPARRRAEPVSQGLGTTKAHGPAWRARKRAAFWCCVTLTGLTFPPNSQPDGCVPGWLRYELIVGSDVDGSWLVAWLDDSSLCGTA